MGKPPPKRLRKRHFCTLCDPRIEFECADDLERHFIADHDYDYCQICSQIGPISLIRVHILENHSQENDKLKFCCYICCGSGSIFSQIEKLTNHFVMKHDLKSTIEPLKITEYYCFDCDHRPSFPSILALIEHLKVLRHFYKFVRLYWISRFLKHKLLLDFERIPIF